MVFQRFLKNSGANIVYRIFSVSSALIATPLLINGLGSKDYGLISFLFVLTINGYASLLDSGFSGAITKFIAEYNINEKKDELQSFMNTSIILYTGIGLFSSILILTIGFNIVNTFFELESNDKQLVETNLYIISGLNLIDFIGLCFISFLQGFQKYNIIRTVQILKILTFLLLIYLFSQNGELTYGWLTALFTANFIAYFIMILIVKKMIIGWRFSLSFDKEKFKKLLSFSSKIFILRITGVLYNNLSKTIIAYFGLPKDVTVMDVALKVNNFGQMSYKINSSLMVPASSELNALDDVNRMRKLYIRATIITASFSINSILIVLLNLRNILEIWINQEIASHAFEIGVFLSYLLFFPLVPIGWNMMIGIGKLKKIIIINLITVFLIILLALILVPQLSIVGLGVSLFLGNLLATSLYINFFNRYFKISRGFFFKSILTKIYSISVIILVISLSITFFVEPFSVKYFILIKLFIIFILSIIAQYYIVLKVDERNKIKKMLSNVL